jgi:hypothetical protein
MAQASSGGSNTMIAVLVGALAVAVAVIGWFVYSAAHPVADAKAPVGIELSLPKSPLPDGPKMPSAPIAKPH